MVLCRLDIKPGKDKNRIMSSKSKHLKFKKGRLHWRKLLVVCLFVLLPVLLVSLGWIIVSGIAQSVTTGDAPADNSANAAAVTTTASTTHATVSANTKVTSSHIVLYDVTHSALLYSNNADEKCAPASLTKLLTAALVSQYCSADEVFTVGSEIALVQTGSSSAYLEQGYKLTRDMIIDALLLPSGNDAAYTIAAHVGRKVCNDQSLTDIEAVRVFIRLMNEKLQEIGAVNSHFSDPDGFDDSNHYTTASDMLLIAKNALKYENLCTSMAKTSVTYTLLSGQSMTWKNTNYVINKNSPYYIEGATGMKTGSTDNAGYCVVVSAERNGVEMIAIVMGGVSDDSRWKDADTIVAAAFAAESSNQQ